MPKLRADGLPEAYPAAAEVDAWCDELAAGAAKVAVRGQLCADDPIRVEFGNNPCTQQNRFVRFEAETGDFYGYWQPALCGPAPLLVNLPGYGGRVSMHPQLADAGFHVLHVSPRGYVGPNGADAARQENGVWPVLMNTARGAAGGYVDWLRDVLLAIRWAEGLPEVLPGRLSLFGTSQGGGTALLLASVLGPKRVRCACADLPFLTDFAGADFCEDAYSLLKPVRDEVPPELFWRNLGFVDTLSHAHRLTLPVMLTAGGRDGTCPPHTVEKLFSRLPGTRQYTLLEHQTHCHGRQSTALFGCWLRMFA